MTADLYISSCVSDEYILSSFFGTCLQLYLPVYSVRQMVLPTLVCDHVYRPMLLVNKHGVGSHKAAENVVTIVPLPQHEIHPSAHDCVPSIDLHPNRHKLQAVSFEPMIQEFSYSLGFKYACTNVAER